MVADRVTDMKLDVVSVVVEVEEVSILPRFLLAQLFVEGLVGVTGRVSAALFVSGGRRQGPHQGYNS